MCRRARCGARPATSSVRSLPSNRTWPAVGSISRSTRRATVDFPEPLSPTRPSVSRARCRIDTPSTARTRPATRRRKVVCTGNALPRSVTDISGSALPFGDAAPALSAAWTSSSCAEAQRVPMSSMLPDRRHRVSPVCPFPAGVSANGFDAARVLYVFAAGREPATHRDLARLRDNARDHGQWPAERSNLRHRAEQTVGVRVRRMRVDVVDRPRSTTCPAYITTTRSADIGNHSEVVGHEDHGHAELASADARELENLRLDRDIERGGGFVGDEQLRVRRTAPSRSWRAGACRPRTRAGSS